MFSLARFTYPVLNRANSSRHLSQGCEKAH